MALNFKYWDDCAEKLDIEALWMDLEVGTEWLDAGETKGEKVHLSRDPDGQPYLTQTEMRAVAEIIVRRHFDSQIDSFAFSSSLVAIGIADDVRREVPREIITNRGPPWKRLGIDMVCAIAELESDRLLLATRYTKKTKETTFGLMQILPKTADWLFRDLHYQRYEVEGNPTLLHKPFVNVYVGAAYLKWLSNYEQKERSEEFVVRAFKGGTKKATHKSTLPYWRNYLSVKESLPSRRCCGEGPLTDQASGSTMTETDRTASGTELQSQDESVSAAHTYWDSRTSPEDMQEMWNHREVHKEWMKNGQKRGQVRFSLDEKKRPYLSRIELKMRKRMTGCIFEAWVLSLFQGEEEKAVSEIILSKHFGTRAVKPVHGRKQEQKLGFPQVPKTVLCALTESISSRFLNGHGSRIGLMGIDYPTADWIYKELSYRAYIVESAEDLKRPFVSMYFGAAYMAWLSEYEGRERSPKFVVQAYLLGPKNVNLDEPGPAWLKFEEELGHYEDIRR
ncbi:hypothetical protein Ancab_023306 [Ancistrocladus abbreviatus]